MEILFDDLTEDAQKRLLEEAGVSKPEDMYWDEVPVAIVEFIDDNGIDIDDIDDHAFDDNIYDYGYDGYS